MTKIDAFANSHRDRFRKQPSVVPVCLWARGKLGAWSEESLLGFGGVGHEGLEGEIDGHWHLCGRVAMRAGNVFFSAGECCIGALTNLEIPSS